MWVKFLMEEIDINMYLHCPVFSSPDGRLVAIATKQLLVLLFIIVTEALGRLLERAREVYYIRGYINDKINCI